MKDWIYFVNGSWDCGGSSITANNGFGGMNRPPYKTVQNL